jgi:hypothetical protein
MTSGWATRFPRDGLSAALPLRLRPGVEAHDAGPVLWLRGTGPVDDEPLTAALRRVPAAERFTVDAGQLTPAGRRLSVGPLPAGPWVPFAEWAVLRLPPAALPAEVVGGIAVQLVAADHEQEVAAALLPFDRFAAWAVAAPLARLDRLRFAVRADGTALVVGRPPPPLAATVDLADHAGLLVPAGLTWCPPVDAPTLRRALGLPEADLALFDRDGAWEHIPGESLVPVTRASVRRMTAR